MLDRRAKWSPRTHSRSPSPHRPVVKHSLHSTLVTRVWSLGAYTLLDPLVSKGHLSSPAIGISAQPRTFPNERALTRPCRFSPLQHVVRRRRRLVGPRCVLGRCRLVGPRWILGCVVQVSWSCWLLIPHGALGKEAGVVAAGTGADSAFATAPLPPSPPEPRPPPQERRAPFPGPPPPLAPLLPRLRESPSLIPSIQSRTLGLREWSGLALTGSFTALPLPPSPPRPPAPVSPAPSTNKNWTDYSRIVCQASRCSRSSEPPSSPSPRKRPHSPPLSPTDTTYPYPTRRGAPPPPT